jgi:hypothetical protein
LQKALKQTQELKEKLDEAVSNYDLLLAGVKTANKEKLYGIRIPLIQEEEANKQLENDFTINQTSLNHLMGDVSNYQGTLRELRTQLAADTDLIRQNLQTHFF